MNDGISFESFVESVREVVLDDAYAGQAPEPKELPIPFGFCVNVVVVNLSDQNSPTVVTVTSNLFGTDSGNGTLNQLQTSGIVTQLGYTVIAMPQPGGGGTGTIDDVFFQMSNNPCSPLDLIGETVQQ